MKTSAIIPVKTFSNAKTRLDVDEEKKIILCKLMFEEVLKTLSASNVIDKIIVVSKDDEALKISKQFNTISLADDETGVNAAVAIADDYVKKNDFDISLVFPQDIPFIKTQDIDFLLQFQTPPKFSLIVPSRRFDGTNALVRMPVDLMKTHYDEDSYKIHLTTGKSLTSHTSLVFVRRIMMDVDNLDDLRFSISQNEKPSFSRQILQILDT
ncbi:MAG TPA: 2-phospho-L-lactate guanylyltransferase [Nitrosopumilaceae archaeon]|nr:2-phospho-L-lactate guanylyltransferase [Nitrosopumilaceae archaeon]